MAEARQQIGRPGSTLGGLRLPRFDTTAVSLRDGSPVRARAAGPMPIVARQEVAPAVPVRSDIATIADPPHVPLAVASTANSSAPSRVPQVTPEFWVIKLLATTVGETAADFLNSRLGLGLANTTLVMGALLLVALHRQFALRRYVPSVYWTTVVLISVVGTLLTDNLSDHLGVSLITSTTMFSILLAGALWSWHRSEGTLSIHSIRTARREAFYWLTVLCTFALGTAGGDLAAERLGLGYWISAMLFGAAIGIVLLAHRRLGLGAIVAFWSAYIMTRPMGASIGDELSQPPGLGGLGLGTTVTSVLFLLVIAAVVVRLSATGVDVATAQGPAASLE